MAVSLDERAMPREADPPSQELDVARVRTRPLKEGRRAGNNRHVVGVLLTRRGD